MLWPGVRVRHKSVFYQNGWTDPADFFGTVSTLRVSCTVMLRYLQNKCTSVWNFVPYSGLGKTSPLHIDRRKYCRLSLTDDRRQFVTLSVHHCLQHDDRDAARCADSGPSIPLIGRGFPLPLPCWLRGPAVENWSLADVLSLSCARLVGCS